MSVEILPCSFGGTDVEILDDKPLSQQVRNFMESRILDHVKSREMVYPCTGSASETIEIEWHMQDIARGRTYLAAIFLGSFQWTECFDIAILGQDTSQRRLKKGTRLTSKWR